MQISEQKVVSINYVLKNDEGETIDECNDGSFLYLHGAHNIVPGLEHALIGKIKGDQISVAVSPEEGYGEFDQEKIQAVPKNLFPEDQAVEPGMAFHAEGPDGEPIQVTVREIEEESIVIDGNHPLAGVTLNFNVNVMDVREATDDELEHGHVHGPSCQH